MNSAIGKHILHFFAAFDWLLLDPPPMQTSQQSPETYESPRGGGVQHKNERVETQPRVFTTALSLWWWWSWDGDHMTCHNSNNVAASLIQQHLLSDALNTGLYLIWLKSCYVSHIPSPALQVMIQSPKKFFGIEWHMSLNVATGSWILLSNLEGPAQSWNSQTCDNSRKALVNLTECFCVK